MGWPKYEQKWVRKQFSPSTMHIMYFNYFTCYASYFAQIFFNKCNRDGEGDIKFNNHKEDQEITVKSWGRLFH